MKLFAVAGRPISHSLSPVIHNEWLASAGITAQYLRLHSLNPRHALQFAQDLGICGLNVTAPYKEVFLNLIEPDIHAKSIGAINTIYASNGIFQGTNTDWQGVAESLLHHLKHTDYKNFKVVVLGAGGAAKAAAYATAMQLHLKTTILARRFQDKDFFSAMNCAYHLFEEASAKELFADADIVISTIPADAAIPYGYQFKPSAVFFDAIYKTESNFFALAKSSGLTIIHGTEWLLRQAKPAFNLFTGNSPNYEETTLASLLNQQIPHKPIILIGMMGCGKSSVAQKLSERGLKTLDIDQEIERVSGQSVKAIFETRGEPAFRQLEFSTLQNALAQSYDVIACGGGIVTTPEAVSLLQNNFTIWLWSSPEAVAQRLHNQSENRPLLSSQSAISGFSGLRDKVTKLSNERFHLYAKSCAMVMDSQTMNPAEVAQEIAYETGITTRN